MKCLTFAVPKLPQGTFEPGLPVADDSVGFVREQGILCGLDCARCRVPPHMSGDTPSWPNSVTYLALNSLNARQRRVGRCGTGPNGQPLAFRCCKLEFCSNGGITRFSEP